ncbi:MAG: hypothetical protein AB1454_11055 [Candidatus Auribacterota bacterium]
MYLKFVEALSGINTGDITEEGAINFAKAWNNLHALAPRSVLKALHKYQHEIAIINRHPSEELKQLALNNVVFEMRKDLKIKPSYKRKAFEFQLWSSRKKRTIFPTPH